MVSMIVFILLVFLSLIEWVILIDIILSWMTLVGLRIQPRFIQSITLPLYNGVRRYIPTGFRGMDFAPLIVVVGIELTSNLLVKIDPSAISYMSR